MVKRKKNEILESMTPGLTLGFASMGAGMLSTPLEPFLPAGIKNPMSTTASVSSDLVGPVMLIGGMDIVLKKVKKIERGLK